MVSTQTVSHSQRLTTFWLQLTAEHRVQHGLIIVFNLLMFGLTVSHPDIHFFQQPFLTGAFYHLAQSQWKAESERLKDFQSESTDGFKLNYYSYHASQPELSA